MSILDGDDFLSKDTSGSNQGDHKHADDSKSAEHVQQATPAIMTPKAVIRDVRKTFANPTPLAALGLAMALTPFSCDVMGWRGAGGNGAASIGSYYFMGGLLMIIGAIGEWIMGKLSLLKL
jgi:succinate-acetate transporter protein